MRFIFFWVFLIPITSLYGSETPNNICLASEKHNYQALIDPNCKDNGFFVINAKAQNSEACQNQELIYQALINLKNERDINAKAQNSQALIKWDEANIDQKALGIAQCNLLDADVDKFRRVLDALGIDEDKVYNIMHTNKGPLGITSKALMQRDKANVNEGVEGIEQCDLLVTDVGSLRKALDDLGIIDEDKINNIMRTYDLEKENNDHKVAAIFNEKSIWVYPKGSESEAFKSHVLLAEIVKYSTNFISFHSKRLSRQSLLAYLGISQDNAKQVWFLKQKQMAKWGSCFMPVSKYLVNGDEYGTASAEAKNLLHFIGNLNRDWFEYSEITWHPFRGSSSLTTSLSKSGIKKLVELKSTSAEAYEAIEEREIEREIKSIQNSMSFMHFHHVFRPITYFVDPYQKVKAQAERLPSLIAQLYNECYCIYKEPAPICIRSEPAPICIRSEQPVRIKIANLFKYIKKLYFFWI